MPSLVRFLSIIAVFGLAAYTGLLALAEFVQPRPRQIETVITLNPRPAGRPAPAASTRTSGTGAARPTEATQTRTAVAPESPDHARLVTTLESFPFATR